MRSAPRLVPHQGMREFVRLTAEAIGVGLAASVLLLLAAFAIATHAEAAAFEAQSTGMLRFKGPEGFVDAPLVATEVEIDVAGVVARTRVTQRFVNPGTDWREGIYVFPLPETAAVDHLDMRIGTRRIVGQIRERGQARREYEQAKSEGKKAALVEQERPNLFTTSVAPIGPGEEVSVSIEYQQPLRQDHGAWSLRFPMAITPRYIPGTPLPLAATGEGWAEDTDRVPDASRITPPVVHPSAGKINPVTLTMDLDAGVPLARLESRYHAAKVVEHPGHRYTLTLDGPVPADRDFEVTWVPELGHAPSAAVFGEMHEGRGYALVMLMPTLPEAPTPRLPREVTFVIDTSGSMEGPSIVQAKAALALALERLQPGDRFNVIEFNSNARALFATPMPVDPATLGRARAFVGRLKADGGTEMHKALTLALPPGEGTPGLVRQVVFLTDGAVGNEDELFKLIRDRLGDRRLFTVGIGSAPNAHFMRKAAEFGRGTHTLIGDTNEVQLKMGLLFRKLESPVLTDVTIDWPAGSEAWPGRVGDLYAGEPLVATASLRGLDGEIVVRGTFAGAPWRAALPLSATGGHEGIHALWARAKIDALTDAQVTGANADDVRAEIVRIALAHHLVTRHTSLVAVDVTPTMPAGTTIRSSAMPGNLPEGQDFEAIFGSLPQTATPAAQHFAFALAALVAGLLLLAWSRGALRTAGVAGLLAAILLAAPQADAADRATLLLPGHYDGDVGSLDAGVGIGTLPADGWFVLDTGPAPATLHAVPAEGGRPAFLVALERSTLDTPREPDRRLWLRVPGAALREGPVEEVALKRRVLVPRLDHRYELALGSTSFALTARNGLGGRDGAHWILEVAGERYEYFLPGFGWDTGIRFAGDLDRDGRPDFVVYVAANNGASHYLLLSSLAQPGMNKPSATLTSVGC